MNRHRQIRKYVQIVNIYQNYGSTSIPFFLVYVLTPITKMENVTNICDPFASLGSTREWRRVVTDQTRTADLVCVCVCVCVSFPRVSSVRTHSYHNNGKYDQPLPPLVWKYNHTKTTTTRIIENTVLLWQCLFAFVFEMLS